MWITTTAKFRSDIPDVLWDSMDADEQQNACVPRQYAFNTDSVYAYNESRSDNCTTIRFHNMDSMTIEMPFEKVDAIFQKL